MNHAKSILRDLQMVVTMIGGKKVMSMTIGASFWRPLKPNPKKILQGPNGKNIIRMGL